MGLLLGSALTPWDALVADGLEDSTAERLEWWMESTKPMNERTCLMFYKELESGLIFNQGRAWFSGRASSTSAGSGVHSLLADSSFSEESHLRGGSGAQSLKPWKWHLQKYQASPAASVDTHGNAGVQELQLAGGIGYPILKKEVSQTDGMLMKQWGREVSVISLSPLSFAVSNSSIHMLVETQRQG